VQFTCPATADLIAGSLRIAPPCDSPCTTSGKTFANFLPRDLLWDYYVIFGGKNHNQDRELRHAAPPSGSARAAILPGTVFHAHRADTGRHAPSGLETQDVDGSTGRDHREVVSGLRAAQCWMLHGERMRRKRAWGRPEKLVTPGKPASQPGRNRLAQGFKAKGTFCETHLT